MGRGKGGHREGKEGRKAGGGKFVSDDILAERAERKARAAAQNPWDGQSRDAAERHRSFLDKLLGRDKEES